MLCFFAGFLVNCSSFPIFIISCKAYKNKLDTEQGSNSLVPGVRCAFLKKKNDSNDFQSKITSFNIQLGSLCRLTKFKIYYT